MVMMKKLVSLLMMVVFFFQVKALEVKGRIDLPADWQPVVFLASLNDPENLFVASPDFIIAETLIQPDGTFNIQASSVPDDPRFYRLYLVKGTNSSVEFNTSDHRNYIHLLLEKNSVLTIDAAVKNNVLTIESISDPVNNRIQAFDKELTKSREKLTADITKAQREYLLKDRESYIKSFIDAEPNDLVALYALYHLDDKETDFLRDRQFYFNFQKRIGASQANSFYADAYDELLNSLIGYREMVCEMPGVQPKWKDRLLIAQAVLIVLLLIAVVWLMVNRNKNKAGASENRSRLELFGNLTVKQQEILKLLAEGKTNKEIANELFIELSTVKTHINSIYKQLNLSNRQDAIAFYQALSE